MEFYFFTAKQGAQIEMGKRYLAPSLRNAPFQNFGGFRL